MRYFLLFSLCVGSSTVFCASDDQSKKNEQMQELIRYAVVGDLVDPSFKKHFGEDTYKFNLKTKPLTKIAVEVSKDKWIYGELKMVMNDDIAVKTTNNGGSLYKIGQLRNLAPNEK